MVAWASDRAEANAEARAMVVLVPLALEGGPRRWRQALSSLGCCRGGGADRGRGTARCWEWCSGCWGSSGGRSSNRRRASPIDQCLRPRRARECGTLPSMLFSFFFTLLSLADELLSGAVRPVSRACIGGGNSLSASASKTLEASTKKKVCVCKTSRSCPTAAVSRCAAAEIDTESCQRLLADP